MNTVKISYRSYYRNLGVMFTAGSIVWFILCSVVKLFNKKEWSRAVSAIEFIILILFLALIFGVYAYVKRLNRKRDRQDELYKENKAKTNQTFIDFLGRAGEALILFGVMLDRLEIKIDTVYVVGIIYLLYGVYNFIAMTNETDSDYGDDE